MNHHLQTERIEKRLDEKRLVAVLTKMILIILTAQQTMPPQQGIGDSNGLPGTAERQAQRVE